MQRLLIAASAVAVAGFMAPPARPASVRMDASVDSILEDIKGLTLVEASELVSKIEETFGVDASSCAKSDGDVCPGDKSRDGPSSACVCMGERGFHRHVYMCIG